MNIYDVRISGHPQPIQVRASKASIALARALRRLTDSHFLNTAITIRYCGPVPRVYHVKAAVMLEDGSRRVKRVACDLPTKMAAQMRADRLAAEHPEFLHLHITSSLSERWR
jgi:hypothetical protein